MNNDKFFQILSITFKFISCMIISSITLSLFITIYQYLFHGLSISYFIIYLPFISLFYLIFCVPLQLILYKVTKYNLKYLLIYIIISAIVNILIIDATFRNKFEVILTIIVSSLIYWFFDSLLLRNKK
ncbi:UPF0715 family protein [Bacillus safensis]|uniref:Uncharacterized protein n=1 Tax=Bacillus safensis TaxID=561879 RepID=A0A1L6ZFB0_BACIA|nr:hypothetical protein BSA145_04145 [Bacillus safensis]